MNKWKDVKKVVLAVFGGLDMSIDPEMAADGARRQVVTFTADLGQGDELEPARKKAELLGGEKIYIRDVREEFVGDFVFPMFRANAQYEGLYCRHLDRRPLIAEHLVEIARRRARMPSPMVPPARATPGPLRTLGLCAVPRHQGHRAVARLVVQVAHRPAQFRARSRIRSPRTSRARRRSSVDANLLHSSSEGKVLEAGSLERATGIVHQRTISPMDAPDAVSRSPSISRPATPLR